MNKFENLKQYFDTPSQPNRTVKIRDYVENSIKATLYNTNKSEIYDSGQKWNRPSNRLIKKKMSSNVNSLFKKFSKPAKSQR